MTLKDGHDVALDQRLAGLTRQASPDPAVWTRIEAGLTRPSGRGKTPYLAVAAAAAGLALLGALLLAPPQHPSHLAELSLSELQAMQAEAPRAWPVTQESTPTSLQQAWQENQDAIAELEQALRRNPENTLLLDFLSRARLRQAELFRNSTIPLVANRSITL